jgi:hypothetical protein
MPLLTAPEWSDGMDLGKTLGLIIAVGAAAGVLAVGWKLARRLFSLLDELAGEPAEYGRPAKPGLIQKVDTITDQLAEMRLEVTHMKHELFPNSGTSLRDAVDRLERQATSPAVVVNTNPTEHHT